MSRRGLVTSRNVHLRLVFISFGTLDRFVHCYTVRPLRTPQLGVTHVFVQQVFMWSNFMIYLSVFSYMADW